jgi:hypothetical protein
MMIAGSVPTTTVTWRRSEGEVRDLFRLVPRPGVLANLAVRALLLFFGAEAIQATISDPNDRRFAGKGIALRNALLVGAFSMLLPVLHHLGPRRRSFPWAADALMISVPVADMAGNSLDLYNTRGWYDFLTHFYGTAAVAGLMALAANGRGMRPAPSRWFVAAGGTTFFHVLLEIQEYWTDILFGTRNVEGLEDTEGDLLAGVCGVLAGVGLAETLVSPRTGGPAAREAARLGSALDALVVRDGVRRLVAWGARGRSDERAEPKLDRAGRSAGEVP